MATTTQHVRIGRRHGVEWICYREPGETDREFERRLSAMREAFLANGPRPVVETTGYATSSWRRAS